MRILIITLICLALAAPASAGLYKWTDTDGKIHFTGDPSQIPLDQRNKKNMKKLHSRKGDNNQLPASRPAPKHPGAKKEGSESKDTGIDQKKVKDLQRLIQKRHYTH